MMKKIIVFLAFIFLASFAKAQHKITLQLNFTGEEKSPNSYYFASNLNGWNPSVKEFKFKKNSEGKWLLILPFTNVELIQYKITRGSWESVESTVLGDDIGNRIIKTSDVKSDTTISILIANWKDNFTSPKLSSASKNVKIVSENFPLTKLGKTRRVWIYLPEGYETSKKRYPVIYMHDGQNLFDVLTGPFGEWGVDECLDTLSKRLNFEVIVVGIDNGGADRLSEYSPYDFKVKADEVNVWDVKGTGSLYLEDLVQTVKPYIDQHYRTKKDKKHTSLCGSSMGGLISLYGIMRYPNVFSTAGVFSPAFWTNEKDIRKEITERGKSWKGRVYMFIGELEGKRYSDNMNDIEILLKQVNNSDVITKVISNGQHNEKFWRSEFPYFIKFLSKN